MKSDRMSLVGVIVAAVLLPAVGAQAIVRYVALDGSGTNGQSWATAYGTIQAAINDPLMVGGGEIRVKQGTYQIKESIAVTKAVRIYGGYVGSGDTRNWTLYQTTVNGGYEAFHCFHVTGNATIDGFALMGGSALGSLGGGGGIAVVERTATISNCLFKTNRIGGFGAGLATVRANGTKVVSCTFTQNSAGLTGGAIYNEGGTGLEITNCTFTQNSANDSGGAIHNIQCGVTISGCLFQSNRAGTEIVGVAGGVLNEGSPAIITNCTFSGNAAPQGAGIFNYASNARIEGCLFANCATDTINGGGIYNNAGSPTITSCLFQQNAVVDQGGAIVDDGSGAKFINCIVWRNFAQNAGGAIYIAKNTSATPGLAPQFINCTIYGNGTGVQGGAVYSEKTPSTFANCIIWGNSAGFENPGIYSEAGPSAGQPTARYCDIQGDSMYPGTANLRADPVLGDPSQGDFSLDFDSPCLDTGSNADVLTILKDYEDAPRVVDGDGNGSVIVDIGACEFQGTANHLKQGEIMRSVVYDDPSDSTATYTFMLRLVTDDALTAIEFRAPGGTTLYQIPSDASTSSGGVRTYHRVDGKVHTWEYWAGASDPSALAAFGDGTYRIIAHFRNGAQTETQIAYLVPGTASPISQPVQRPIIQAPIHGANVASPVTFSWEACTDPSANSIYLTITNSSTDQNVAGDVLAKTATASAPYTLSVGTFDGEVGFASLYDKVLGSDGTPFRCGKTVLVGVRFTVPYNAVYRFWSAAGGRHFYTLKETEKQKLIDNYSSYWSFEGVAFNASSTKASDRLLPVYRFWSGQAHFYTISETERNKLVANYGNVWTPEGIAFYAYPEGAEPPECKAVYRFWNVTNSTHFFTINEAEANKLMTTYSHIFNYEGVAFYAYPP